MIRFLFIAFLATFLGAAIPLAAQSQNLERDLDAARQRIEQTTALVRILPPLGDSDIQATIQQHLQEARSLWEEARSFAQNRQPLQARARLGRIRTLLRQVETLLRSNSNLGLRYREEVARRLQDAELTLQGRDNREAQYLLERARRFRQRADQYLQDGQVYQAIQYYQFAVRFSNRVVALTGQGAAPDDTDLGQEFLATRQLLEEARAQADRNDDRRLHRLLRAAENELESAKHLFHNNESLAARQRLMGVNRALYRILDILDAIPQTPGERLEPELQSLRFAMASLEPLLQANTSPAIQRLMERLQQLEREIHRDLSTGQHILAQRKLRLANQILLRLYQGVNPDRDDRAHRGLENRLRSARETLTELQAGGEDAIATGLSEMAAANLDRGETAFQNGNLLVAAHYLQTANRLMLKINRLQAKDAIVEFDREAVEADLQRLEQLLDRTTDAAAPDTKLAIALDSSRRLQQMARKAFDAGDYAVARELTHLAINLMTQ